MSLINYEHYHIKKAKKEFKERDKIKYIVITINWTYAKQNSSKVHKNKYIFNLTELEDFIRKIKYVAENIIKIEILKNKD